MDNLQWIKELIRTELTLDQSEKNQFQSELETPESLKSDTVAYLTELKSRFVAACSAFNQLKGADNGRIKIYGISKTDADFMIFRNGYKMVFSMKEPGKIVVGFNHVGTNMLPSQETSPQTSINEDLFIAKWQAFGRLTWTHNDQDIDTEYLVRHYLSRFIRTSAVTKR